MNVFDILKQALTGEPGLKCNVMLIPKEAAAINPLVKR